MIKNVNKFEDINVFIVLINKMFLNNTNSPNTIFGEIC